MSKTRSVKKPRQSDASKGSADGRLWVKRACCEDLEVLERILNRRSRMSAVEISDELQIDPSDIFGSGYEDLSGGYLTAFVRTAVEVLQAERDEVVPSDLLNRVADSKRWFKTPANVQQVVAWLQETIEIVPSPAPDEAERLELEHAEKSKQENESLAVEGLYSGGVDFDWRVFCCKVRDEILNGGSLTDAIDDMYRASAVASLMKILRSRKLESENPDADSAERSSRKAEPKPAESVTD